MGNKRTGSSYVTTYGGVIVVVLFCYVLWSTVQAKQPQAAGNGNAVQEIELLTSESKTGWLEVQIEQFNEAHTGQYRIVPKFMGTRAGMLAILSNCEKPVLWAPSSAVWAKSLNDEWHKNHSGDIIDATESDTFKPILSTPLVFITSREKAKFLQPLLGGDASPWEAIRAMGEGTIKPPWGPLRFSHANPLVSNCGMLTLSLILKDYAQRKAPGKSLPEVAASPEFASYLAEVEKSLVFDKQAKEGSNRQRLAMMRDPNHYDLITNYESNALDATQIDSKLAMIKPKSSVLSEFAIGKLKGSWVNAAQTEGAAEFLKQVTTPEAAHYGTIFHWKDASAKDAQSNTVPLPPYDAIDKAINQWRVTVAHLPNETASACEG